jgi:hypothetical protein
LKKLTFIILLLLLMPTDYSFGQIAFERTRISVTGHRLLAGNTILRNWDAANGIGFELSAPYIFGNFETGLRYTRFDEFTYEGSGFHSYYVFAGWNYSYIAASDLIFTTGLRFGNNFMLHDQDKIYADEYKFSRVESEFSYELFARLQLEINKNTEFFISTSYNRTIFNIPFAAFYGTAGVTLKFRTPPWLLNFLQ